MLPGKKYTPEDVLTILRRRYWLVLVPLVVVAAATAVITRALPNWYRAETLILVVPQRVPENYVKSTVTARIEDRLQSISQQILSRTRLERVIQDFNLYAAERRAGIMEDIVEKMRRDISVQVVKGDAFRVGYVGREPRTVMKVTERLASLFIEENLRDRELLAEGTNQFLEVQLEDARRRLIEQEKKLQAYRQQHNGELPTQLNSNLQAIQNTQMQIQAVVESLNRDRDRRLILERQIAEGSTPIAVDAPRPANTEEPANATAAQQLDAARAQLKTLEARFKPEHPDINILKRRIQDLEAKAEAEALAMPVSPPPTPVEAARQKRLALLRDELDLVDRQIAQKTAEEKRLRGVSQQYQTRAEAVPARETELVELTRDYTGLQTMYSSLLAKKEESKIAANLERRQIGEQFKLLDPARMPERPFSPNRQLISVVGLVAGLGIGLALVALLEYRDNTLKTDDEVLSVLALPVLAIVPLMRSDDERRKASRRKLIVGVGLGSTVTACIGVVVYTLVR